MTERPATIVWFERLMYVASVVSIFGSFLDHDCVVEFMGSANTGPVELVVFSIPWLLLVWLAARRRKSWARWVITVFFAVGVLLPILASDVRDYLVAHANACPLDFYSTLAPTTLLQLIAMGFLFAAPSRAWFVRKQD
jgi:hypothetical protein